MEKINTSFAHKVLKILKWAFLVLVLLFISTPSVFSYWTMFVVSVPSVDVTLDVLKSANSDFIISPDLNMNLGFEENVSYVINPQPHCDGYNDEGCINPIPNLCPYLALEPKNEENTEVGFTQNPFGNLAKGEMNYTTDLSDKWNLLITSPCFEGECGVDYDSSVNGEPLAQSLKGQIFKCDLSVESSEVPPMVINYFNKNIAYADTNLNTIQVSATFTGKTSICTENCFSNVLFLPGIMGSRLYDENQKELWVTTNDADQANLGLDISGKSVNSAIHTKDDTQRLKDDGKESGIVDQVNVLGNTISSNIYQSFLDNLRKWKLDDKIIEDYDFIPYDWRLSLNDIINNGKDSLNGDLLYNQTQDFSESFILKKLAELQKISRTGKVTIIAHSNGGLVAKALIQKLKDTNNPLYDEIDKVILVAVPQVGTPEAFINLLHGIKLGPFGFVMNEKRARNLSENMPMTYNLLPSLEYFSMPEILNASDKLITFSNSTLFNKEIAKYSTSIDSYQEFKDYISGTDGRIKPEYFDTIHPNIGNTNLQNQAENIHQMLDNWQASPNTKVIQVAGWGEETKSNLEYQEYFERDCSSGVCIPSARMSYKINTVVDGDGTVVVPSALWMPISSNVERWWLDLKTYNKPILGINRDHRDILEVPNLLDFIKAKIKGEEMIDLDKVIVNKTDTLISNGARLHYTLHSPLTLGITDSEGRYTGLDPITNEIKQEILGVNYEHRL